MERIYSQYRRQNGGLVEMWFAPEFDGNVVRVDFSRQGKNGVIGRDSIQSTYQQYDDQIWFPAEMDLRSYRDDEIVAHEIWRVESASFNQSIPADVFTLAGLQMDKNTHVFGSHLERPSQDHHLWDGEKLVEPPIVPLSQGKIIHPPKGHLVTLIMINLVIGLLFIAGFFLSRRRKSL